MARTFFSWLETSDSAELKVLLDYARTRGDIWVGVETLKEAQALLEGDHTLPDADARRLQIVLARAFLDYERTEKRPGFTLMALGPSIFVLMVFVLGIIAVGIFHDPSSAQNKVSLLDQLTNAETARGLITFIFALGVMSLALIIVSANFISTTVSAAAFDRAKEVFTSLVAILGTILGFYFGVAQGENTADPTEQTETGGGN